MGDIRPRSGVLFPLKILGRPMSYTNFSFIEFFTHSNFALTKGNSIEVTLLSLHELSASRATTGGPFHKQG